ncbi:MAG: hypothetical protein U5K54_09215 [Cytophagales bacterium]|nr:hypothetical protein [Cytophagales bacterium]
MRLVLEMTSVKTRTFLVTLNNMKISTSWTKYTIPIPDPSRLIAEKGLFWYAEGPENDKGSTLWIDELKFEKLGTVAQPRPAIFNGEDADCAIFYWLQYYNNRVNTNF